MNRTTCGQVLAALVAASAVAMDASAQTAFSYQGSLSTAGTVVTGAADLRFRLYSAKSGGQQIGSELFKGSAAVDRGVFSVDLDFGAAAFYPGASRWLEVDVRFPAGLGSYATISPRTPVNPVPLAQGIAGIESTRAGTQAADQNQWDGYWSGALTQRIDFAPTWESFTAGKTGALTRVELDGYATFSGPQPMTVRIRAGVGTQGPVLGSATISVPPGQAGLVPALSFPNVSVVAGSKYTIEPVGGAIFLIYSSGDIAGAAAGPTPTNRFVFLTYVTPEATIAAKSSKATFADAAGTVDWSGIANVPSNVSGSYPAWGPATGGINYSGGSVGIGNSQPQSRLHISGDVRMDTNYTLWFGSTTEADPVSLRRYQYQGQPDQSVLELTLGNDPISSGNTNDAFIITANNVTEFQFNTQSGGQALKAGGGSWGVLSDARAKHDINPLAGALERLLHLRGKTYFYNDAKAAGAATGMRTGFVAQEVEPFFPEWIGQSNGMKTLNITGFEALTVEALRDLRIEKDAQIDAQKREIEALKGRLERLEKKLEVRP